MSVIVTDPEPTGAAADRLVSAAQQAISFTFRPIVSAASGLCYGFEAVAQGMERLGFPTLRALYDQACGLGAEERLELALRETAITRFAPFYRKGERLFLSFDRRSLNAHHPLERQTTALLTRHGLNPTSVCLGLSEAGRPTGAGLDAYRRQSYLLALDHFGDGAAGLRLIYDLQPHIIRIASRFTADIDSDERKRLFLETVVGLARVLGITVIADGVTTATEFRACKQIGCHLVQGDFVDPPNPPEKALTCERAYPAIIESNRQERRERRSDQRLLREELTLLPAVNIQEPMTKVFHAFRSQKDHGFLPIVDDRQQPLGIIREIDLKEVIYSRYGKDLLHNKALHRGMLDFLRPCPVCDINTEAEKILEIFSQAVNPPGVLLVDDFAYVGVLSAASLLRVINEKNLAQARDQNPLTRLPGNSSIANHISSALESPRTGLVFAYFDLDNFKPFNDRFGFRQGDRAILLFSDLMRARLGGHDTFLGHIGGDDFFAAFHNQRSDDVIARIAATLAAFGSDVESFYDPESRARGSIIGRSRDGQTVSIPLLTCSAAVVDIPSNAHPVTVDDIGSAIAVLKKAAKSAPSHIALQRL